MHFWNKLSTAALMRLTILVSLNLMLGRMVGQGAILLHPLFFLIIITLNLGLYAIMVYTGILNTTLIGMMLGGLTTLLAILAVTGMDAASFSAFSGPFAEIGHLVESLLNRAIEAMPAQVHPRGPIHFHWNTVALIGYGAIDALGVVAVLAGGWLARSLQTSARWHHDQPAPLPLDADAASPL